MPQAQTNFCFYFYSLFYFFNCYYYCCENKKGVTMCRNAFFKRFKLRFIYDNTVAFSYGSTSSFYSYPYYSSLSYFLLLSAFLNCFKQKKSTELFRWIFQIILFNLFDFTRYNLHLTTYTYSKTSSLKSCLCCCI